MYPLDVTMSQAWCNVAGGLEFGAGSIHGVTSVRGHRPGSAPGVWLVRVPPIQACCLHGTCMGVLSARKAPCVLGTLPPREAGPHIRSTHCIIGHAMAKQLALS